MSILLDTSECDLAAVLQQHSVAADCPLGTDRDTPLGGAVGLMLVSQKDKGEMRVCKLIVFLTLLTPEMMRYL